MFSVFYGLIGISSTPGYMTESHKLTDIINFKHEWFKPAASYSLEPGLRVEILNILSQ